MSSNAIGGLWDSGLAARRPGFGPALDGLRDFDRINAALRSRQDVIERSAAALASGDPSAGHAAAATGRTTPASALAGAVGAYANSDAGRERLEKLAGAAAQFLGRLFGSGGPEQLALPLEV
jgi:hypothetical protein